MITLRLTKTEARELHSILTSYADAGAEEYEGSPTADFLEHLISKLRMAVKS